jgi:peptide/nickel transport system permease protein
VEDALAGPAQNEIATRSGLWEATGRFRRNPIAMAAAAVFVLLVVLSLLAPYYAHNVARENPFLTNVNGTTVINGKRVSVLQPSSGPLHLGETPIGPTWDIRNYFLGADGYGRDVAALVLYGGRTSLEIGLASAGVCCGIALIFALISGFYGGGIDWLFSRVSDLIWAMPVYMLAISIGTVLITAPHGLQLGPINITADSVWLPILLIGFIYIPYAFRPIRAAVLTVRRREFIDAAISQGAGDARLIIREVMPNVLNVVIVLFPLLVATNILTESALSFLGIGVQPPNVSWGTLIADGQTLLYTRPWVTLAPGFMIVVAVLALNLVGDGLRDALDPKGNYRLRRVGQR